MIERIEIDNFRLFGHFEMDNIKQINLIAGANNVGKTSLLEAIEIYNTKDYDWINILKRRNHSTNEVLSIDKLGLATNSDKSCIITININNHPLNLKYQTYEWTKALRNYEIEKTAYIGDISDIDSLCENFNEIGKANGKLKLLISILQELEPRIKDLRLGFELGKLYITADIGLPVNISISSLGDGINKLLTILLTALRDDCKILLLDEIETGFHYSFYPKLWNILAKLAKETGCQIFATTHSYECIEGAKELNANEPDMFGFFRLDRDNNGNIIPKVFTQSMFETSFENGWEVR
jgi:AAA15 family ATPase/GTPase